jgi:uncharacterized membrane protein YphA (DoxX/SURF4 family)
MAGFVYRHSTTTLRVALGVVFVWFGALKLADATPVGALVEGTTPWPDPSWFVPALGAFEMVMGVLTFTTMLTGDNGVKALCLLVAVLLSVYKPWGRTRRVSYTRSNGMG